nr:hypothetical protein [Tanacetum cinerariifolium]
MASSSAPQITYAQMDQQSSEYSPPEDGIVVPVFQKGDDPIDAINHMMSFLTYVVASHDLDAYDSDCDEINSAKIALMANLSHYGSDNLAKVNNPEIRVNSLNHQERQVQSTSEQFSILTHSNTEIESDSNIIPYSQYLNETQSNTVQNSTLPALQDDLILNVIE